MTRQAAPRRAGRENLALFGLALSVLMAFIDFSIVNVALPAIVRGLHTSFAGAQWVLIAYMLVIAALVVSVGRLGDLFGKTRLFMAGVAIFTLASAACGVAPQIGVLIAARALQGLGGAVMTALSFSLVPEIFGVSRRTRAMHVLTAMMPLGVALGPTLGGLLIGWSGWPLIFLVNVPIGLATLAIAWAALPVRAPAAHAARFDIPGTILFAGALAAYAYGVTLSETAGFLSLPVQALLWGAAGGLGLFLLWQRQARFPLIELSLFADWVFSASLLVSFIMYLSAMTVLIVLPFYLARVLGHGPVGVGLLLSAGPVEVALVSLVAGGLAERFGFRLVMLVGLAIMAAGALALSTLTAGIGTAGFILRVLPFYFGLPLFQTPNNALVMMEAPAAHRGVVSGLLSLSRILGQTTGAAVMGAVFAAFIAAAGGVGGIGRAAPGAIDAGVHGVFLVTAGLLGGAVVVALVSFRRARALARA
ncbi:MAG TPA: MFS transporter [Acetobacteraceae bacterium]|nr:MFS transporter [Acetobacteraceae bacterium]